MPFINTTTEVKVQGGLYTGKVHFVAVPFVSLEIQKLGSPAIKITLKSSRILLHSHSMRFAQMFCDSWPHPKNVSFFDFHYKKSKFKTILF